MMPKPIKVFVHYVNAINRYVGLFAMYMIFAMMGVLLYSSITKTFFIPPLWTLETSQFMMVAYFLLGGAYSMQIGAHVRMDLFYSRWSPRTKAIVDSITILFLLFYLVLLLYGAISSTQYALKYGETGYSAWGPYMAPIKIIMTLGIVLMLLQAIATFFENVAEARGEPLS
jgi:TRAP-type mannitol/chloroaromatic compound transport system permease small subunit